MAEPTGNGRADRRYEGELIDGGAPEPGAVAGLLARLRRPEVQHAAPTMHPTAMSPDELAAAIAAKAVPFLGGQPLDAETDFFDAGGTSVDAVELVAVLARELDVRLSLDDIFADGRPRRLAQRWLAGAGTAVLDAPPATPGVLATDVEELALITADLARADALPWVGEPEPVSPSRFLVTGANGFLGSHLLLDLLRRGDAHAVCLVRGADDRDAERRLGEALAGFDVPWSAEVRRRVTVLAGDLRLPRLGLTDERWDNLACDVDSIVSVGAAVDFLRGYPSLRQTNVLGPLTLAELAMTGRPKPLHHISSIAVFNEVGIAAMGEDDPVAHVDRLVAGYDKTKWAAEAALRRAREHGLVATFLRPGGIAGHTVTGAYNSHDLSCGFLSAFSRYRTVPAFRFLNVAAVDWVSKVAAAVICEPDAWGQNYNLAGRPNTLTELVRDMELAGLNVEVLDWDQWRADFLAKADADPVPELDFLVRVMRSPTALMLCEASLLGPDASGERTERFVAKHDLPAPTRYDGRAGLRNYERMAHDRLLSIPGREDPPHLWFPETMKGRLGPLDGTPDTPCTMKMTLSIASMYQLVRKRTIHVSGTLTCSLLHTEPLVIQTGDIWVRPDEGVPLRHGTVHPLLRYRLVLRDADGQRWWLEGWKSSHARRDLWKQARRLTVEIGRDGEQASFAGVVVVPGKSYVKEQIDGIQVNPRLSMREQRVAKLTWLAWFGLQMGQGLLEPSLRAAAELLDLRRDAIDRDKDRLLRKVKKMVKDRELLR
jgi:thioester reductase-like protein